MCFNILVLLVLMGELKNVKLPGNKTEIVRISFSAFEECVAEGKLLKPVKSALIFKKVIHF